MFAPLVAKPKSKIAESFLGFPATFQQEVAREPASAETARRAIGWDFGRVPLFAPTLARQPETLPGAMSTKLVIGEAGDPLEHEADRVALQVMRARGPRPSIAPARPAMTASAWRVTIMPLRTGAVSTSLV